jgi:acyl-coenzyme A thioesterase PaaI-like protein
MDESERTESAFPDPAAFVRTAGGVSLCAEPCGQLGACRLGISTERLDPDGVARFDVECPADQGEGFGLAHGGWAASVLCELAGHRVILSGTVAYMGTLTVRFAKPVPVGEPLLGHAVIDGHEGRKIFVSAAIVSPSSGAELASAAAILITPNVTLGP